MSTHSLTCAHEALELERTGDVIALCCRHCAARLGRTAPGLGYQTQYSWRAPFKLIATNAQDIASSAKPSALRA